jgi:hypothetical protein
VVYVVQFNYFQTETGSTIVTYGQFPHNARKSFPDVNLQKLNALAQAHNLTVTGKVKLLLKLQRIKNIYAIGSATDSVSADRAIARWIGEKIESIDRIKAASSVDKSKFVEALDAMAAIGEEWAKDNITTENGDTDLANLGFDIQHVQGFISYGSRHRKVVFTSEIDWGLCQRRKEEID